MSYNLKNIGDKQLEPPVMPKVDIDWYGCSCGCDELYRLYQTYECQECFAIIATEHSEVHDEDCPEKEQ